MARVGIDPVYNIVFPAECQITNFGLPFHGKKEDIAWNLSPGFYLICGKEFVREIIRGVWLIELQTKVREDFTITEKVPTRAYYCFHI